MTRSKVERTYRPVGGRVLVAPDVAESASEGGILFADSAKELPLTGTVMAVCESVAAHVKPGDRVCWGDMYQIKLPKQPDKRDLVVLRYPEEILFLYEDKDVPLSAEEQDAADAYARVKAELRAKIDASMKGEVAGP